MLRKNKYVMNQVLAKRKNRQIPIYRTVYFAKEQPSSCSFSYTSESQAPFYVVCDVSQMAIRLENGLKKVGMRGIMS